MSEIIFKESYTIEDYIIPKNTRGELSFLPVSNNACLEITKQYQIKISEVKRLMQKGIVNIINSGGEEW